jgi:hypothetical protein
MIKPINCNKLSLSNSTENLILFQSNLTEARWKDWT